MAYAGPARSFVHAWKERGLRRAADLAADIVTSSIDRPAVELVTAVPADAERLLRRGYHPATRLAQALADRWQLSVANDVLCRPRVSPRQAGLGLAERRRNVAGTFAAGASDLPNAVLLVDDVYTTGATAAAAAAALRAAGARTVDVVTFARAVRRG